jgi:hypothetical protein
VLLATMSDRFLSGVVEQLGLSSYSMLALYGRAASHSCLLAEVRPEQTMR